MADLTGSVSYMLASIITDAGLGDLRTSDGTGDVFLDVWPLGSAPNAAVLLTPISTTTDWAVDGWETSVKITVRGEVEDLVGVNDRANLIYKALYGFLSGDLPAGDGITVHAAAVWPTPPVLSRVDRSGRPEVLLYCRVEHGDLSTPDAS